MWNEGRSSFRARGVHTRETQPGTARVAEQNPSEFQTLPWEGRPGRPTLRLSPRSCGGLEQHPHLLTPRLLIMTSSHPNASSQLCHVLSESFHLVSQLGFVSGHLGQQALLFESLWLKFQLS